MDTFDAVFNRHSIRKYTKEQIPEKDIELILRAAMAAPSAGNSQSWHFIVVDDIAKKEEILTFHHHAKMIIQCSHAIVVCADLSLEKYEGRWMLDCSAATENMLLAATDLGIGSVWVGIYPVKKRIEGIKSIFNLPDTFVPVSIVALGYPAEEKEKQDRFKPERIHRNIF